MQACGKPENGLGTLEGHFWKISSGICKEPIRYMRTHVRIVPVGKKKEEDFPLDDEADHLAIASYN